MRLVDALVWSGDDLMISLFALLPAQMMPFEVRRDEGTSPDSMRIYALEDPDGLLLGYSCIEYDLVYAEPPVELAQTLSALLETAVTAGAELAWLAFEGSFSFDHLLSPDVAPSVYGVATSDGVTLALGENERTSPSWAEHLLTVRRQVGL